MFFCEPWRVGSEILKHPPPRLSLAHDLAHEQLRCPGQRRHARPCVPMSFLPRWRNSAGGSCGGAMRLTCFSMSARTSPGVIADSLGWAPSYAIGRAPGCSPSLGSVVDRAIRVPYLRQHLFRAFDMVLGILLCVCVAPCRAHELVHLVGLHRAHARLEPEEIGMGEKPKTTRREKRSEQG